MNKIISLHGIKKSGKDTICSFIKCHIYLYDNFFGTPKFTKDYISNAKEEAIMHIGNDEYLSYVIAGQERFAKPLKAFISSLYGIEDLNKQENKTKVIADTFDWQHNCTKSLTIRDMHCIIADAVKKVVNQDIFASSLFDRINSSDEQGIWLVNDLRFENELKYAQENGSYLVKIIRPVAEEEKQKQVFVHESEAGLPSTEFDYIIRNDGSLNELFIKVADMLLDVGIVSNQYVKFIKENI